MIPSVAAILGPQHINLALSANDEKASIAEVISLLANHPAVLSLPDLSRDIYDRISIGSPCLGHQIAFAHARTAAVSDFALAVGRSPIDIPFSPGGQPVRLILVLGSPKQRIADHLALISLLARALIRPEIRERATIAPTPDELIASLSGVPSASRWSGAAVPPVTR